MSGDSYRRPRSILDTPLRAGHGQFEKFIHLQESERPSADDPIIGHFDSALVTARVVELWNAELERRSDG